MAWMLLLLLSFDLTSVKSEPNLERRSELALANANASLDSAKQAYESGDPNRTGEALKELEESVDLAYDSLSQTGKDPRGNPKYFKRAEMTLRILLRRLEGVAQVFSITDRERIEAVRMHVSEVHDQLIDGIMSKKKKGAK